MAQCSSLSYIIRNVDKTKPTLLINKGEIDNDSFDITILGKRRKEYGEDFNNNLLHILENFSCPASDDALPMDEQTPDLTVASDTLLSNPTPGQFWHNSSIDRLYYYSPGEPEGSWVPLSLLDDVAGNRGQLNHGEQIPQPVSPITGYVFSYDECSWTVAPAEYDTDIDYMRCYTDMQGNVTMQYRTIGGSSLVDGVVNYQIIGIRGYDSTPETTVPVPPPSLSATPTPTTSPEITPTPSPTSGTTPTPTPTPSSGASPTPTPTPSPGTPLSLSVDDVSDSCQELEGNTGCLASVTMYNSEDVAQGDPGYPGNYTLSGGSGDYSYNWYYVSGASAGISDSTTASPTLSRSGDNETVGGTFELEVTDNISGATITDSFSFVTSHTDADVSPTPTSSPDPTPTPTPTSSPDPTPTPTPTPSSYPDLAVSTSDDAHVAPCIDPGETNNVRELSGSLTVTGGSGNYDITQTDCTGSLCSNITVSIDDGAGTATVTNPATGGSCGDGPNEAVVTFSVEDLTTGETFTNQTVTVSWEIDTN